MNPILFAASLSAFIGLFITACRIDRETGRPRQIATMLMLAGVAAIMLWSFDVAHQVWGIGGASALLFGLAIWLAWDRRYS